MDDRKINVAVNLPLKIFRATVENANTGGLKSLHIIIDMYMEHVLVKFEPNCMVQNEQNFELFDKKSF